MVYSLKNGNMKHTCESSKEIDFLVFSWLSVSPDRCGTHDSSKLDTVRAEWSKLDPVL